MATKRTLPLAGMVKHPPTRKLSRSNAQTSRADRYHPGASGRQATQPRSRLGASNGVSNARRLARPRPHRDTYIHSGMGARKDQIEAQPGP